MLASSIVGRDMMGERAVIHERWRVVLKMQAIIYRDYTFEVQLQ